MKQILSNTGVKLFICILLTISTIICALSIAGVAILSITDSYFDDGLSIRQKIVRHLAQEKLDEAQEYYDAKENGNSIASDYEVAFQKENSNFYFYVTDAENKILLNNYKGNDSQFDLEQNYHIPVSTRSYTENETFSSAEARADYLLTTLSKKDSGLVAYTLKDQIDYDGDGEADATNAYTHNFDSNDDELQYNLNDEDHEGNIIDYQVQLSYYECEYSEVAIHGYVATTLTAKDVFFFSLKLTDWLIANRYRLIVTLVLFGILCILLLVFLVCAAGHRRGPDGREEIRRNMIDKIPLDLYVTVLVSIVSCAALVASSIAGVDYLLPVLFVIFSFCMVLGVCVLSLILTCATRLKLGKWWRNTVIFRVLRLIWHLLRWMKSGISFAFSHLSLWWRAGLIWAGISLFEFVALCAAANGGWFGLWFLEKLIFTPVLVFVIINLQELKLAGKELAHGNLNYKPDIRRLRWDFREHGQNLCSIRDGMQVAVDEQTRSQRMKAELITNVSHDIKTPLTSIINYVELLKNLDLSKPEEAAKSAEYIAVLDRQSARLKKLTLDIVEASKASTGNISVQAEKLDLGTILAQAVGEYEHKLQVQTLIPVLEPMDQPLYAMADGRLLWRVFDNLLNNITKYALGGTRVYIAAGIVGNNIEISFKNISATPLNMSREELMERFVRGDSSRNTEGSGLGLSIAQSLTELQGASFDISIDGDLFKAVVSFPRLPDAPASQTAPGSDLTNAAAPADAQQN